MSDLINPHGLDDKTFTGERDADGFPIMRFPELTDIEGFQQAFFDHEHSDEVMRKQRSDDMPDENTAVATIRGIFALAQAEQNDRMKRGWDIDYPETVSISPDTVQAVIDKFIQR